MKALERIATGGSGKRVHWRRNGMSRSATNSMGADTSVVECLGSDRSYSPTPGHGGDIKFGRDMVWTSMANVALTVVDGKRGPVLYLWVGPGGDALGIGHGAIC
jgi:hypothetical protein